MHSNSHGPLKMVLIFAPLIVVPLLAIFGLPNFSPLAASPSVEPEFPPLSPNDIGVGESAKNVPHDLFAPVNDPNDPRNRDSQVPSNDASRKGAQRWNDPFDDRNPWNPPKEALGEWEVEKQMALLAQRKRNQELASQNPQIIDEQWPSERSQQIQAPDPRTARNSQNRNVHEKSFLPQPTPQTPVENTRPFPEAELQEFGSFGTETDHNQMAQSWPEEKQPEQKTVALTAEPWELERPAAPVQQPQVQQPQTERQPAHQPVTSQAMTWQQASARLQQLGIRRYQLVPGTLPNEFHFSCLLTPANNPRITRRFEAEASDPLRAVAKVISQIENWQQSQ